MSRRLGLGTIVARPRRARAALVGVRRRAASDADADALRRGAPATTITVAPSDTATVPTTVATTTAPTTTVAPTTTPPPPPPTQPSLPVPVEPPPEDGSDDPRVDLGSIEIPRLGLAAPDVRGHPAEHPRPGPGHWPGTAMPGELGNVVVAGHRVSHNADFRNLDQLAARRRGDVHHGHGSPRYLVSAHGDRGARGGLDRRPDADHTATLFACHPPGSIRQRIVVHLAAREPEPLRARASAPGSSSRCALPARGVGGRWRSSASRLFELALGDGHRARATRFGLGTTFGAAWMAMGMGWMWQLTAPGYVIASVLFGLLPRARRAGRADGPLAPLRAAGRPHAGRGGALLVPRSAACRWPASGSRQAAGPLAGMARVGGVILITWVVFQLGFALGALLERRPSLVADVAVGRLAAARGGARLALVAPSGPGTGRTPRRRRRAGRRRAGHAAP